MSSYTKSKFLIYCFFFIAFLLNGCGQPRVIVATGTQIGLEATPGDVNAAQAPSVSFGYKRAELALVPVGDDTSHRIKKGKGSKDPNREDAYSVLATFNLALNWFGPLMIEQFVATGHASRDIQAKDSNFYQEITGNLFGNDDLAAKYGVYLKASLTPAPPGGVPDPLANKKTCWLALKTWKDTELPGHSDFSFANHANYKKQRSESAQDAGVKNGCQNLL